MRRILVFLIASLCNLALPAQQTISLQGQIKDRDNGAAVPFAAVRVNEAGAYADGEGRFFLQIMPSEGYLLSVDQLGYQHWEQRLLALPAEPVSIDLAAAIITLEEILVADQRRQSAPQAEVLHDPAKAVSQPRDIGDLLGETPGFGIIRRGGYALDPVFRAFKYEQLNLIFDGGVQLTHACPNRMDPAVTHVTPEEVEKIELIKGPFSVRYGPSMGATLNIVTQGGRPVTSRPFRGVAESGYETNGNGRLARLALFGGNQRYDFYLNGGWKDFDSYAAGNGATVPSAFTAYDYALKAGVAPSAQDRIQLSWRQSFSRDILHAALPMDTDTDNSSVLSLDYSRRFPGKTLYRLTTKAYGSWVDHVMSNTRRPNFMMMEGVSTVKAATYGGKVELNWLPGRRFILYTGMDLRGEHRAGDRIRTLKRNMMTGELLPQPMVFTDNVWQDASLSGGGLFAEGRWLLNERWTLIGGLRADLAGAAIGDPAPDFLTLYGDDLDAGTEVLLSGNASLAFRPAGPWTLQLSVGRGVRPANLIERSINHFTVGQDPFEYVGNPFLRAEANHQAEWSTTFSTERLSVSGSLFFSYLTDYITAAVDSTLARKYNPMEQPRFAKRFVNMEEATQLGGELSARYRPGGGLELYGSLAYTRARNLDWDEPLPEIPPLEGILGVKYERAHWWIDARGRFADQQNRYAPSFGETPSPGFAVYDLRAGVQPWTGLTLGVAALNVFDRYYYEHLNRPFTNMPQSGVLYEPGRNGSVFLRVSF